MISSEVKWEGKAPAQPLSTEDGAATTKVIRYIRYRNPLTGIR
jgi:hypothetical protein